jgi:hypothetical protein
LQTIDTEDHMSDSSIPDRTPYAGQDWDRHKLLLSEIRRIHLAQPGWNGVITDAIKAEIEKGLPPGYISGNFVGWDVQVQGAAAEYRRQNGLPEPTGPKKTWPPADMDPRLKKP